MNLKNLLRRSEIPFVIFFFALWVLIYVCSRVAIEMAVTTPPRTMLLTSAIISFPFILYITLRVGFANKSKWYGFIGYYLICSMLGIFAIQYMLIQGTMLLDVALQTERRITVPVLSVEKVFKRKSGFDHTAVRMMLDGNTTTMEARPYAYFYLHGKKTIDISFGNSRMGGYATSIQVAGKDKWHARWLHLKDIGYRHRLLAGIILLVIIGSIIKFRYFPDKPGKKPVPMSFWKMFALIMGILVVIAIVLIGGLLLYVSFFASRS